MDDLTIWLQQIGLGRYAQAFADNDIDAEVLPDLTDADLETIGVSLGHRRKLLKAIAARTRLAGKSSSERSAVREWMPARAERRQLTVMFCDLVGSTALAGQVDPEDLRDIIALCQGRWKQAIDRYDGYVARYLGDGLLAYFGYPQAHEDDAERAVRTGLELVAATAELNAHQDEGKHVPLAVRVGIATGPVVVGDIVGEGASQESAVIGETPNLAARLQALAAPGTVTIAPRTHDLVATRFEHEALGPHELKGFARPVHAWRVVAPIAAESRFDAHHESGLTPLVGREHEVGLLVERWYQAREGEGQVVLLSGEAGIGKSRVVRSLRERIAIERPFRLRYQCSPYHTDSALRPVIEQLEHAVQAEVVVSGAGKLERLESLLARSLSDVSTATPLIADLLSIPNEERYPPLVMAPGQQKEKTFEALISQVEGLGRQRPVLLVFEDVHWADPTTLELLDLVIRRVQHTPALLVITFRPGFQPPWTGHSHITSLTLNRMSRRLAAALADGVAGGKSLPDTVRQQVIDKTDGVPLFVEELTKNILESGILEEASGRFEVSEVLEGIAIPATLYDSLVARLDRLGPIKQVAQLASVIGREFSHDLLAAASTLEDRELRDALQRLVDAELVLPRGQPSQGHYTFKHALVQDAAYQSLLRETRRTLHRRIAEALERRFKDRIDTQPELLARHLTEAGLSERAIRYWTRAGHRASERSSNVEAVAHFRRAMALLETARKPSKTHSERLDLHLSIGPPLMAVGGWACDDVGAVYERARELAAKVGDPGRQFAALWGLWLYNQAKGRFGAAHALVGDILALTERLDEPGFRLQAHHAAWTTEYFSGDLHSARMHSEHGLALYDFERHRSHAFRYGGHDAGVCALDNLALCQWLLGQPDEAMGTAESAVALARRLEHPFSTALALNCATRVHHLRGDVARTLEHADAMIHLCTDRQVAQYLPVGKMFKGWALIASGQWDAGVELLRMGLDAFQSTGANRYLSFYLVLLAEASLVSGHTEDGIQAVDEAVERVSKIGERRWESETYRLKGELLLRGGHDRGTAQACFERALGVARAQGAIALELRACTSLARLWHELGRSDEARALLAPVHARFSQGTDTADVCRAGKLLSSLT